MAEEECRNLLTLSFFCFLIPPSLRATSPVAHTCAEEEVNAFLLNCLCSCFDFGATSRDAVGKKCKIYLSTPNGEYPLTPSPIPCGIVGHSHTPPLYFAGQNTGEEFKSSPLFIADRQWSVTTSIFCWVKHPAMLRGTAREEF